MYFVRPDLHVRAGPLGSARGACISFGNTGLRCRNRGSSVPYAGAMNDSGRKDEEGDG